MKLLNSSTHLSEKILPESKEYRVCPIGISKNIFVFTIVLALGGLFLINKIQFEYDYGKLRMKGGTYEKLSSKIRSDIKTD